jgi:hypothetical protein
MTRFTTALAVALIAVLAATPALTSSKPDFDINDIPCCEYEPYQAIVWTGTDPLMTVDQLVSYCAPILWFSPDEPTLGETRGPDIRMPTVFPFQDAPDAPVVYYRIRSVLTRDGGEDNAFAANELMGSSVFDLRDASAVDLDFFFYYPTEEGFGGHDHDVESTEMKVLVWRREDCAECPLSLIIARVTCKAHGVLWYDNTLEVDQYTKFPLSVLVEEGKHAGCTDKNQDGYYTPGYDVNVRINDAWGVRDVIRGGGLFSGAFESWFAKVRTREYAVFPPLPEDSPLRENWVEDGVYAPDHAKYEIRPFPHPDEAAHDPVLLPYIADKGDPDWPELKEDAAWRDWLSGESFVKSLSVAFRMDGDAGVSAVFPLFVVKNFSDPIAGGWLVNRIYFKDTDLRDFGYGILYTGSASRWLDGYFAVGAEWDSDGVSTQAFWTAETGIKLRGSIKPLKVPFLKRLTDFWGMRVGVQYGGLLPVDRIKYVIEIGGGSF